jgi:hypothetical protein
MDTVQQAAVDYLESKRGHAIAGLPSHRGVNDHVFSPPRWIVRAIVQLLADAGLLADTTCHSCSGTGGTDLSGARCAVCGGTGHRRAER